MFQLNINGTSTAVDVDDGTPLLFVLRDTLGMTGTKYGCGIAQCGACTVLMDGQAMRSCQLPVEAIGDSEIVTIEAIEEDAVGKRVVAAWIEGQVPQCGYCQSGMLMAAASLLAEIPDPSDEDIDDAITNICRCGTYPRIRAAIKAAAGAGGTRT